MVQKLSKPMPYSPCKPPPAPSAFKCLLIESQMCVATYLKSGSPSAVRGTPSPSSLTTRHCSPFSRLRVITTVLACASMLFSTNSAIAFRGLLWESAMMRIAFQSSPIRNLPFSDMFRLAVPFFVTDVLSLSAEWKRLRSTDHATITCGLNPTQSCAVMPQRQEDVLGFAKQLTQKACFPCSTWSCYEKKSGVSAGSGSLSSQFPVDTICFGADD